MQRSRIFIALALIGAVGPALAGMRVERDPEADFSAFRTYSWQEGAPAPNPEVQKAIVAAIDEELAGKGLGKVADGDGDLVVKTYVAGLMSGGTWGDYNNLPNSYFGILRVSAREFRDGALMIELYDASTDEVVWAALAGGAADGSVQKVKNKARKFVKKMFAEYPSVAPQKSP